MTEPKYLLVGGLVVSQSDGDAHYVSAHRLQRLYGLRSKQCVLADGDLAASLIQKARPDIITLRPRTNGDYTLEARDE